MKKSKKLLIILGIIIIFLLFSIIFSIINMGNDKILKGIKIGNIDISNLNLNEAREKVSNWYKENNNKNINLYYKDLEESINVSSIIENIDYEKAVDEAYKIGRDKNIILNNYEILYTLIFGKKIDVNINFNNEEIEKQIDIINSKLPGAVVESNYYIEDNNLIIKNGANGIKVKQEKLKEEIKKKVEEEKKEIAIEVENASYKDIDIEKIHGEIYRKVQNASITTNPTKINPEINGVDFDISIEEAKKLLEEEKEEYIIPLKITYPEITINKLAREAFPDKLGEFTTRYDSSYTNRSNNLELAASKIDGTVILPGETFSYNKIVGARTIEAGYKEAAIYSGGKVVDGIGGGICQLSSTLYNAVVYANLEVTKRTNHSFITSYIDVGRDATVSWGTIDFCFKNTRKYPVKVIATVGGGVCRVGIYGIKEEKENDITIQSEVLDIIPRKITYIEDNTLDEGVEIIEQNGSDGYKSITYKIEKQNGAIVSKTVLSTDTYSQLEQIIKKGTKSNN